jgi:hypothetical protein
LVLNARDANACGGCFHKPAVVVDTGFVTDHRMVLSMSPTQTVLWDQVRYTGSPEDFAWVLPIKPGARIEMSHDAWIAALDATTQTVITGPTPLTCGGGGGGGGGGAPTEYTSTSPPSGGGGCGGSFASGGGVSTYYVPQGDDASAGGVTTTTTPGTETVQVVSQQVVGPYDAVTVHSTQGEALGDWLRANGYALPASVQPVVDAYAGAGFDFIALKLAPRVGIQAMQPVRVVTPGADPTLPLRMVAAGVGVHVGLELYVLSEGRYHPANFPDATVDFGQLAWDPYLGLSNYTQLAQQALAAGSGTGWLTESSQRVDVASGFVPGFSNPGLSSLYQSTCTTEVYVPTCLPAMGSAPVAGDGGPGDDSAVTDAMDAGEAQATDAADARNPDDALAMLDAADATGDEAGDAASAREGGEGGDDGGDAGTVVDGAAVSTMASGDGGDGGSCGPTRVQPCDDLSVALVGIPTGSLWVTRLRADFPAVALSTDMVLEATASQVAVSSQHHTDAYTVPQPNTCPPMPASTAAPPPAVPVAPPSRASGCACRVERARRGRYADATWLSLGAAGLAFGLRRRRRGSC